MVLVSDSSTHVHVFSIENKVFIAQFHVHRLCCGYNFLGSRHTIQTVWHWQRDTFRWFACTNSIITSHQHSHLFTSKIHSNYMEQFTFSCACCLSTFNVPLRWLSNVNSLDCANYRCYLSHNHTSNEIILERGYVLLWNEFLWILWSLFWI